MKVQNMDFIAFHKNMIPFIIQDADKLFYYRGLKEYKSEKGYLTDTCLNAQDQYIKMIEYYLK